MEKTGKKCHLIQNTVLALEQMGINRAGIQSGWSLEDRSLTTETENWFSSKGNKGRKICGMIPFSKYVSCALEGRETAWKTKECLHLILKLLSQVLMSFGLLVPFHPLFQYNMQREGEKTPPKPDFKQGSLTSFCRGCSKEQLWQRALA